MTFLEEAVSGSYYLNDCICSDKIIFKLLFDRVYSKS